MRNRLFKNDILVFSFINSEDCQTFDDLIKFLKENNLPVLERWGFYLIGKLNLINEKAITDININEIDTYGGLINVNIYHWKYYLKNMSLESLLMTVSSELEDNKICEALCNKYFNLGWEYVQYMVESDFENKKELELRFKKGKDDILTI